MEPIKNYIPEYEFEKVERLAKELAECQQQRDGLREVEAAARIIFDVTVAAPNKTCPHGISPSYPTHAWWCDDCFGRLETALAGVQDDYASVT